MSNDVLASSGTLNPVNGPTLALHSRSSSRMFETYLRDIERLLQKGALSEAIHVSAELPHVCVALADSALLSSCERYKIWWGEWARAVPSSAGGSASSADELYAIWEHSYEAPTDADWSGVPVRALRQLQLKRLVRNSMLGPLPLRFVLDPTSAEAVFASRICMAALLAARLWYAKLGSRDQTVQRNLARLALWR